MTDVLSESKLIKKGSFYDFQLSPVGKLSVGNNVVLRNFISIEVNNGASLTLGDNVYINNYSNIRCFHSIEIGENTMLGDGVRIFDFDHSYSAYHIGRLSSTVAPVVIGKNSWIGPNCVITKGVTIGDNVIIGAGTVVTKDVPNDSLVYGQKNLVIKKREQASTHAFILTVSDRIEHIEYLLEHLPEMDFHIAAPTCISSSLEQLGRKFSNCQLYPLVYADYSLDILLKQADCYLDINHGREVDEIISKALEYNKVILSFSNTSHRLDEDKIIQIDSEKPELMVSELKNIIGSRQ